jgi:hypothetical protein
LADQAIGSAARLGSPRPSPWRRTELCVAELNRDPQHWRDSQQLEHVLGKYLISDQPMTEEQWARERATVIDEQTNNEQTNKIEEEPARFGDGREENHLDAAKRLGLPVVPEASPLLPQISRTTKKSNK